MNGDVYWARDNDLHLSVFMVTPEDHRRRSIGRDFSTWLKATREALQRARAPRTLQPQDYDHASGTEVFADTAKVVAHEHAALSYCLNQHALAQRGGLDANKNGKIEQGEAKVSSGRCSRCTTRTKTGR